MHLRLATAALFLCVPAAALAADETPPTPAPSEAAAQPEKPKKICRMETSTGSVMPRRVCRTPEQVAADHENARNQLDERNRGQ
jgi:hypothetical protein